MSTMKNFIIWSLGAVVSNTITPLARSQALSESERIHARKRREYEQRRLLWSKANNSRLPPRDF